MNRPPPHAHLRGGQGRSIEDVSGAAKGLVWIAIICVCGAVWIGVVEVMRRLVG